MNIDDAIAEAATTGLSTDDTHRFLDALRAMRGAPFEPHSHIGGAEVRDIHPSAVIGLGSTVWAFARILPHVVIGAECCIGGGTEIGRGSRIGDRSRIGANVFLPPNSLIGTDVFIGPNVTCTDDKHPRAGNDAYTAEPPVIGNGASIGAGAVLLPGVVIGAGARVAAGAVVTSNVPPRMMVIGAPARERPMPAAWLIPPPTYPGSPSPLYEDAIQPTTLT